MPGRPLKSYFARVKRQRRSGVRRIQSNRSVISKSLTNNTYIYPFRQIVSNTAIVSSTTLVVSTSFVFKLSDLPQYTTFTSMFDTYRILSVNIKFIPRTNIDAGVNGNAYSTTMFYAIDYDDINVLGTISALQEFGGCKAISSHKTFSVTIHPKVARTIFQGGVSSAYEEPKSGVWIDAAYPNVEHYGLRTMIPPVSGATGAVTYDIVRTFMIQMKHVK